VTAPVRLRRPKGEGGSATSKSVTAYVRTAEQSSETCPYSVEPWTQSWCAYVLCAGPRLFLSCPLRSADAQVWFTDLWNYSIVPYIVEALRDTNQVTLALCCARRG